MKLHIISKEVMGLNPYYEFWSFAICSWHFCLLLNNRLLTKGNEFHGTQIRVHHILLRPIEMSRVTSHFIKTYWNLSPKALRSDHKSWYDIHMLDLFNINVIKHVRDHKWTDHAFHLQIPFILLISRSLQKLETVVSHVLNNI